MSNTRFAYRYAFLPDDEELILRIDTAAGELYNKIIHTDAEKIDLSSYGKAYFSEYKRKLFFTLQGCCFNLIWSVYFSGKKPETVTLVDNGGGLGILSLLAKTAGIGTVCYNDIFETVYSDAQKLATALGIPVDHFIHGDIEQIADYLQSNHLAPHIITSRNTVEHIYNLPHFFSEAAKLNTDLVFFFSTTSNPKNPLIRFYLRRIHLAVENKMRGVRRGETKSAELLSFSAVRKNLITEKFPNLTETEKEMLAKLTRGKRKEDIFSIVEKYLRDKKYPDITVYGSNTCDPITGSWAENLLPLSFYEEQFIKNGFHFRCIPGFYNTKYKNSLLNMVAKGINFISRKIKFISLSAAPFIGLAGVKGRDRHL